MSHSSPSDRLPKSRVLDQVSVPNPCPMSWDAMDGDDRVRRCVQCNRHVWNFFEMTDEEIRQVLRDHPDRLCAQIVKTADGKLLSKDNRPARPKFRFSMLAMMAIGTCLSPLILYYPNLYRWLVAEPEPPVIYPVETNWLGSVDMIKRMKALKENIQSDIQDQPLDFLQPLDFRETRSED